MTGLLQLEEEGNTASHLTGVEKLGNMRMRKRGKDLALAKESFEQPWSPGMDQLDRCLMLNNPIAAFAQIDCTHSAFAEQRFHPVLAVEHGVDDGRRIGLEDLAINRTEGYAVVVFRFA